MNHTILPTGGVNWDEVSVDSATVAGGNDGRFFNFGVLA